VPGRELDSSAIRTMAISTQLRRDADGFVAPGGARVPVRDPLVAAALSELCACSPGSLSFMSLAERATRAVAADELPTDPVAWLEATLLEAYLRRVVILETVAMPVSRRPRAQPVASPLARAQHSTGLPQLTTLAAGNTPRPEEGPGRVLALLDGSRDRSDLAAQLDMTESAVDDALDVLGEAGLLMAL
jgi:DNA-binding transcriptional ArsR family regulator